MQCNERRVGRRCDPNSGGGCSEIPVCNRRCQCLKPSAEHVRVVPARQTFRIELEKLVSESAEMAVYIPA